MVTEQTLVTNVVGRMRQVVCGLHGHDSLLQFGQDRIYLKCTSCGYESPGWDLNEVAPSTTDREPVRQPAFVRSSQLVGIRRVA